MVKNNCFYFIFFCLFGFTTYSQKVSNITYHQEQSNIIVSYDLETKIPCDIYLYVSTNGGSTWQGPLTKVSGDVGAKITTGSHNITWYVLEEFEELIGSMIQFQVRADENNLLSINNLVQNEKFQNQETVVIGTQVWTTKNLDVSTYKNGDIIPEVKNPILWDNLTTGAWCYYDNDPKNGAIYGKLYNWYAVNDSRGLAPKGYHIPSDKEWDALIDYLGGSRVAGGKMKETGTEHWNSLNKYATNSSGFTALPGGYRNNQFSSFYCISNYGNWWSSSEEVGSRVFYYSLKRKGGNPKSYLNLKTNGFSVRCIKD